jgi:hypothetical protein
MNVDLARFMTVIGRINPSIWDAIVPMGPRYLQSVSRASPGSAVELNPQPIPPGYEAHFAAARVANEIALAAIAAAAAGMEEGATLLVSRAVDDWCGTPPGHIPIPWPGQWPGPPGSAPDPEPWLVASTRMVGALTLASVASRIAQGDAQEALVRGAEQLLDAALQDR